MKFRTWHIIRVYKRTFPIWSALFLIFYFLNKSSLPPKIDIVDEDDDFQLLEDQNLLVYNLSETREFLKKSTTNLVYPIKTTTEEDVDSKSLVPRMLHFIWIGSEIKIKGNYLENIITWREKNPTYEVRIPGGQSWSWCDQLEVVLWTDNLDSLAALEGKRITIKDVWRSEGRFSSEVLISLYLKRDGELRQQEDHWGGEGDGL